MIVVSGWKRKISKFLEELFSTISMSENSGVVDGANCIYWLYSVLIFLVTS